MPEVLRLGHRDAFELFWEEGSPRLSICDDCPDHPLPDSRFLLYQGIHILRDESVRIGTASLEGVAVLKFGLDVADHDEFKVER